MAGVGLKMIILEFTRCPIKSRRHSATGCDKNTFLGYGEITL